MSPKLALFNIGPFELLLLAAAAVLLFGGELPTVARRAGQMLGRLRALSTEMTRKINAPPELDEAAREARAGSASLRNEVFEDLALRIPPKQDEPPAEAASPEDEANAKPPDRPDQAAPPDPDDAPAPGPKSAPDEASGKPRRET